MILILTDEEWNNVHRALSDLGILFVRVGFNDIVEEKFGFRLVNLNSIKVTNPSKYTLYKLKYD